MRTCSCLGVYKIIGAGRNEFAVIIICSVVNVERGIIFFLGCMSQLLGLLEDAEHLGHIVGDLGIYREYILKQEYSPASHSKLPVFGSHSGTIPCSFQNKVVRH